MGDDVWGVREWRGYVGVREWERMCGGIREWERMCGGVVREWEMMYGGLGSGEEV